MIIICIYVIVPWLWHVYIFGINFYNPCNKLYRLHFYYSPSSMQLAIIGMYIELKLESTASELNPDVY